MAGRLVRHLTRACIPVHACRFPPSGAERGARVDLRLTETEIRRS